MWSELKTSNTLENRPSFLDDGPWLFENSTSPVPARNLARDATKSLAGSNVEGTESFGVARTKLPSQVAAQTVGRLPGQIRTGGPTETGDFGLKTLKETVSDQVRLAVVAELRIPLPSGVGVSNPAGPFAPAVPEFPGLRGCEFFVICILNSLNRPIWKSWLHQTLRRNGVPAYQYTFDEKFTASEGTGRRQSLGVPGPPGFRSMLM